MYAAACRWAQEGDARHFRAWTHTLVVGQPLPILPLWLADNLAVPLELEATYEETCRILHPVILKEFARRPSPSTNASSCGGPGS